MIKPNQVTDTADAERSTSSSTAMRRLYAMLGQIAKTTISVLLLGETGAGKEVLAGWVHEHSSRASRPFVKVNCAGLTESMVESELFGHERGAFTGAAGTHRGLFEVADCGTLFLDEIGELPMRTQAKLLRVLESGEFCRVGSTQPRRADVRLISATHRDLQALVELGDFRQDLYFRLNGVVAEIPALRERRDEIPRLANLFLQRSAEREGRPALRLDESALAALELYDWPGNIRELRSTIERAVAVCAGEVIGSESLQLGALTARLRAAASPARTANDIRDRLRDYERDQIVVALREAGGNQTRAARALGVSRRTLTNKLNAYGLERPRKPTNLLGGRSHEAEG